MSRTTPETINLPTLLVSGLEYDTHALTKSNKEAENYWLARRHLIYGLRRTMVIYGGGGMSSDRTGVDTGGQLTKHVQHGA